MKFLKKVKKAILVNNFVFMLLGIVMVIIPDFISEFICYIIGGLIICFAIAKVKNYLSNKANNISLTIGIITLLFGILIIIKPKLFASIIPILIGVYIIILSLTKYRLAINYKNTYYKQWYSTLIESVFLGLVGLIILFNPFETLTLVVRVLGFVFIINSLYDTYNLYNYQKGAKDLKKDIDDLLK